MVLERSVKTLDFVIFAFTAVLGLVLILIFFWYNSTSSKSSKGKTAKASGKPIPRWSEPPADKELGDLGVLAKHGSLHEYLLHLHDNGKVPVTSFWWGKTHVVSVCSPQAFKETVRLVNRPPELFKGFEPLIGAASIQYANDADWDQRSKCLYHTLKGEDLRSYFPCFVKIAQETEAQWLDYSSDQPVSLLKEVFPMTIKGIARSCLGDVFESREELDRLAESYHKCWSEMEERIKTGDPGAESEREAEFQQNKQVMVSIVKRVISQCRDGKEHEEIPFINSLLQNYDSEDKIVSDVISFMVGGFHTSGYMFTWMLWYLAENPASQDRLWEELKQEVGGECGDRLREYAWRNDTFMRQVQDETLRLSTLGPWAARYSNKEVTIEGHVIPVGTPIIQALGVGLKNQVSWEDTDKWDPDRFAPNAPHGNRSLEFCPFGVPSRRKCPGYLFSYFEVAVFASILLASFKVIPVEGQKVTPVHGLVTEPKEEIHIYLQSRREE